MRWRRHTVETDTGGAQAHKEAARQLADVRANWREVSEVGDTIQEIVSMDRFSEKVRQALRSRPA